MPEQQLGNVPIQITIQKCETDNQRNGDPKYCQSLWENFISTVKSENLKRPSSARYQTNFNLMISDVMANHTHVLSDTEKSFLGCLFFSFPPTYIFNLKLEHVLIDYYILFHSTASFKLLSDDAQRLFVRIYTRKG